jgi:protein-L-isoaspartate(D-aspartate) O-methyltransferase
MPDTSASRRAMVERQIAARGIAEPRVLAAMKRVPREAFLPEEMAEFAYDDTPLAIEAGQTISQPFIVALMCEALEIGPADRVLEVGTGSGYAAAVLGELAGEVFTVERHAVLADVATRRLAALGYDNVHVLRGDGSRGWPEHAPYDAIVVAAGGPSVPRPLLEQLAVDGRLVIPVGEEVHLQELVRVRRRSTDDYATEHLGGVRFVPLVGEHGWRQEGAGWRAAPPESGPGEPIAVELPVEAAPASVATPTVVVPAPERSRGDVVRLLRETSRPFDSIESADLGPILERIGGARVVLLGEATHGTSEFYRFRARLTRELVLRKGFEIVAVEADWPDAAQVDRWVRDRPAVEPAAGEGGDEEPPFTRFPRWMWRNEEVAELLAWLRAHNAAQEPERRVGFHGLDLYSLYRSIGSVLRYLEGVDPDAAAVARLRYGCLTPWERDPALYGRAALVRRIAICEQDVVANLVELMRRRLDYAERDGERFLDALQNARVVANAERYYRVMYYGSHESWNLRDRHMFDTLQLLLASRGPRSRAVVWEHNSHIGDAAATEMAARGELNVGHLARQAYRDEAYLVGFGTHAGTVAAAHDWDGPMETMTVRPSHPESYERLFHDADRASCHLHLREPERAEVGAALEAPRLERAIGVVYRPETERQSHYFQAVLPWQFDEYVWFDETSAVTPLAAEPGGDRPGVPETFPFGL